MYKPIAEKIAKTHTTIVSTRFEPYKKIRKPARK